MAIPGTTPWSSKCADASVAAWRSKVSYTYSRNIDTTQASTFFSDATSGTTSAMPEFPGFSYNKGLADYHAKHNSVTSLIWQMPFGRSSPA